MRIIPGLVSILTLVGFLPAAGAESAPRTVVFLGDSLTSGHGLSRQEALPARVEELLGEAKLATKWRVVNAGVTGDTTAGGLSRLEWTLRSKPDVMVVALGANDALRGQSVENAEKNLSQILTRVRDYGARAVLVGMQMPRNYGTQYRAEFAEIYPRLAKSFQVPLVPFLLEGMALQEKYTLADGTHPNGAGTRLMAKTVWKTLEPVLRSFEAAAGKP